jgi:DNA adenine methylase
MVDTLGSAQRVKPFLKWAGSKKQILSILSTYWNSQYNNYIEPFVGSASLYFYVMPKKAVLGDINSELISTYRQIKNHAGEVAVEISKMLVSKEEYYKVRSAKLSSLNPVQKAARFIYLNKLSFNGLYRTNQKGDFNVPFGGGKFSSLPTKELLQECSKYLKNATFVSGDFEKTLEKAKPGDFVYLDPPYSVKSRRIFSDYDKVGFNELDVKRLKEHLDKLTERGIVFLLSYAKSSEAKYLMQGYPIKEINVRRNIAGFTKYRREAKEWISSNIDLVN